MRRGVPKCHANERNKKMKKTMTEVLGMNLTAEKYQRTSKTGSHNKTYAQKLLQDCANKKNVYCGAVHLATIKDSDVMAILDGNSRYNDFKKWYNGELSVKYITEETNEKGEKKNVTNTVTIKEAPAHIKANIDSAWVDIITLENLTLEERAAEFKKLNSGKSLTNAQKAAVVMPDSFYTCAEMLQAFMENHGMLTDAQKLNDIHIHSLAQIIANSRGAYAASNIKLMQGIAGQEMDAEKFGNVLDILNETEFGKNDKYELITLATILYNDGATVADIAAQVGIEKGFGNCDLRVADFIAYYTPNCVHCSFDTAGANSADKNKERFAKMLKKVKSYMADKYVTEETDEKAEAVTLADVATAQAARA